MAQYLSAPKRVRYRLFPPDNVLEFRGFALKAVRTPNGNILRAADLKSLKSEIPVIINGVKISNLWFLIENVDAARLPNVIITRRYSDDKSK